MENTKEREISISKLLWKLLLGWRRWTALGIVFAVMISSLLYMKDMSVYQENYLAFQKQQDGDGIEELQTSLTKEELTKVEDVKLIEKQIAKIREYIENSIFMKLEPDNIYTMVLQYYIDSDYTYNYMEENKQDYTSAIATNYVGYVISGAMAKEIKNTLFFEQEEGYIKELISAENTGNTFKIKVLYSDAETLEQMKEVIIEAVESRSTQLNKNIGSHNLRLIAADISLEPNSTVATQQKIQSDMIYNYTTQLNALKVGMTEEQLKMLSMDPEEDRGQEELTESIPEPVSPTFNAIYLVLGFAVGVFLGCIWVLLEVLFTSRVQESEEISHLYSIRIFGEIIKEDRKKKFLSIVDTMIIRFKNRNKKQLTREQQIRIICSNLEIACKKAAMDKIYFTGSEIEKIDQTVLAEIKKLLYSAGIQVCSGENISYDAKSLKEMAEIGCVVFVEQVGLSIYKEIEKEIKIAKENTINILGSIVIV